MAKRYSESEIKRQMAARQGRNARGHFLPLSAGQSVAAMRASMVSAPASSADEPPQIGIVDAANQGRDPVAVSASALLREAKSLSMDAAFAESAEAKEIYAKIQVIRRLAKKTADSESVSAKLDEVIGPVEQQLRKKASFSEYLKERVDDFRKTLPERIAGRIPVVGGLLGGFLQQRRQAEESLGKYEKGLLRRGEGGGGGGMGVLGGTRASSIPGLMGGSETLGGIYKEVSEIRKLLIDQFKPSTEELTRREGDLEGAVKTAIKPQQDTRSGGGLTGILSSIMKAFSGEGGIISTIGSLLSSIPGVGLAKQGLKAAGSLGGRALSAAGRFGGRALGAFKGTSLYKDAAAIGKGAMNLGSRAMSSIANSSVGKSVATGAAKAGGFLSSAWGSITSTAAKLNPISAIKDTIKSGAGKIVKGIVSIPGLGAAISGIITAAQISSIKSDPELSPDEKKERIGRTIVGGLGEALGGIGGGALGTFIPIPGIGTLVGSLGGAWVGGKIAELLADQIGGKGIYDMVSSIPGIGSLLDVGGGDTASTTGSEATAAGAVGGEVNGVISAPATPNTTMGKMASQYAMEQDALQSAKQSAVSPPSTSGANNTSVRTSVNTTVNNFNDDLRIRNNEPTQKTMQVASHSF